MATLSPMSFYRNGRGDEEGRLAGCGVNRRREESSFCRLQKCDWREKGILENNLQHRTKGGEQRCRAETRDDPSVPISS